MQYISNDLGLVLDSYNEAGGSLQLSIGIGDFTVYESAPGPEVPLCDGLNRGWQYWFIQDLNERFDIAKIEQGREIQDRSNFVHTVQQDYILKGISQPRAFTPWHLRNNSNYLMYQSIQLEYIPLANISQLPVDTGELNTEEYWVEQYNHFAGGMGGESGGGGASHTWTPNTVYFYNQIPPQYYGACGNWGPYEIPLPGGGVKYVPAYWTPLLANKYFKDSQFRDIAKFYVHTSCLDLLKAWPEYAPGDPVPPGTGWDYYNTKIMLEKDILSAFCWHPTDNNPESFFIGQDGDVWVDSDYYVSRGINDSVEDSYWYIVNQMQARPDRRMYFYLLIAGLIRNVDFTHTYNPNLPWYYDIGIRACPVFDFLSETETQRPTIKGVMPPGLGFGFLPIPFSLFGLFGTKEDERENE